MYSLPRPTPPLRFQNVADLVRTNAARFANRPVFAEKDAAGAYRPITWARLGDDVERVAAALRARGFKHGDKMVIFSPNRLDMLRMELAVMASGGIAVPIFAHFKQETAELLIRHSDARCLTAAGAAQLQKLSVSLDLQLVIALDAVDPDAFAIKGIVPFSELLAHPADGEGIDITLDPDALCLNMYTSGTMGVPKCVQLSHRNILSQQDALSATTWWNLDEHDRFLSYLPWHHSFGGIFELFNVLYRGACLFLESSLGRDAAEIMANWQSVQPTVFFSVPKVYQALFDLSRESPQAEALFFHGGLKFIFTAAAALPQRLSDEFERRGIPVIEGWGLTETAPCCTLTDPNVKRATGVVGMPIPGVRVRIDDDGEILVKGPNVMRGYYKNDEANAGIFTNEGWFRTGDVGEMGSTGLRIITRKDRIFKLSNGEKVIPSDLERAIEGNCHYVSFAVVSGSGQDYPVALLFPNRRQLDNPDYSVTPLDGCLCPRNLEELQHCLRGCLKNANCSIGQKFSKVRKAVIVDDDLSLEKSTLTPSMKVAPVKVLETYREHLDHLYDDTGMPPEDAYVIRLDDPPAATNA
jgi:long-subunit acyl-CoA synthetase (AMP-forming)